MKKIIALTLAACLALCSAQFAQARGFGGSHGGSESRGGYSGGESRGGESRGGYSGGESRGGYSGGESRGGQSEGESRGGNPGSESRGGYSAGEAPRGATGGAEKEGYPAAEKPRSSQATGAQGAAAGAAASNRNAPQASGAQGAAAGATAANRNAPAASGAQGAAAGAAVANRNQPAYSGAEGAAAGAAIANSNAPQMSGAQGAVSGYAAAGGVGGGYSGRSLPGMQASQPAGLPTDGGFAASAAGLGASGYAASHMTQPVDTGALAAQGASVRSSYNGAGTFGKGWYGAHPDAWHAAGWTAGDQWHTANWGAVMPLLDAVGDVQPIPYNYGTDITYQGNQVYNNGQPVATCDQYYQQASSLAQSAPAADSQSSDWMPLGVFALVQSDQSSPHYVMQLAMNKSGAIAGSYCDLISNSIHAIQGAVDKTTQRVAWTVGSNKNTVGETGLYNLTKDEGPVLIHMGPDKTQQWLLVRINQPPQ